MWQEGDFLVRESQGSQGQYVLTGMQSGHHKHLLLVDPEGVVSLHLSLLITKITEHFFFINFEGAN